MGTLIHFFLVVLTIILWVFAVISVLGALASLGDPKEKRETKGWVITACVLIVASLIPLWPSLHYPLGRDQYMLVIKDGQPRAFYKGTANLPFDPLIWVINWPAGERTLVVKQKTENIWSFDDTGQGVYASLVLDLAGVKPDLMYYDLRTAFPSDMDRMLSGNIRLALEQKGAVSCEETVTREVAKFQVYGVRLKRIVNCFKE